MNEQANELIGQNDDHQLLNTVSFCNHQALFPDSFTSLAPTPKPPIPSSIPHLLSRKTEIHNVHVAIHYCTVNQRQNWKNFKISGIPFLSRSYLSSLLYIHMCLDNTSMYKYIFFHKVKRRAFTKMCLFCGPLSLISFSKNNNQKPPITLRNATCSISLVDIHKVLQGPENYVMKLIYCCQIQFPKFI